MHEQTPASLAHVGPAGAHGRPRAGNRQAARASTRQASRAASPSPAERLRATLRQRLIAFYLMPSDADRWIEIWTSSVATGDPCSAAYWDRGFRWIVTAVSGNGHDRAAPCGNVDPALAAVITRGFRA
jgi:hypothetical protein